MDASLSGYRVARQQGMTVARATVRRQTAQAVGDGNAAAISV